MGRQGFLCRLEAQYGSDRHVQPVAARQAEEVRGVRRRVLVDAQAGQDCFDIIPLGFRIRMRNIPHMQNEVCFNYFFKCCAEGLD